MQIEEQDTSLRVPIDCQCFFDNQSCSYVGVLTLINSSDSRLYFHIVSTFVHFLKFENMQPEIKAHDTLELKFRIKQVNQIIPLGEFIFISWSKKKSNQYCSLKDSNLNKIILNFNQKIIEDGQIDKILQQEANSIYALAQNQFDLGNFKEAGRFFEECFLIYRKSYQGLLGMARSLIEQKHLKQSLSSLELCIIQSEEIKEEASFFKANVLELYIEQITCSQKYQFLRSALSIYKTLVESNTIKKGLKIRSEKGYERLSKIKQSLFEQQNTYIFQDLINRSIDGFHNNQTLSEYFSSSKQFKCYLQGLIKNQDKDIIQTPDYAIDPIQYEIYKQPMITPAGLSYQKQFLVSFFKNHGNKDPQTRAYLNPNSVVQNITLKILVRNNPDLPKWIKYENMMCKF